MSTFTPNSDYTICFADSPTALSCHLEMCRCLDPNLYPSFNPLRSEVIFQMAHLPEDSINDSKRIQHLLFKNDVHQDSK
jgi:hypothetical protein